MYENTLEKIGLTRNEAKVYQVLLNLGQSTVNKIAIAAKIQRRNVYDTVKKLKEKELCTEVKQENVKKFKAVHPKKLLEIIKEKEEVLNNAMPKMIKNFETEKVQDQANVYKGEAAIKLLWQDIIGENKDVLILGDKEEILDDKWELLLSKQEREKKNKTKIQVLFDSELKNDDIKAIKNLKYKFLPKNFTPECIVVIYGSRVASIYKDEDSDYTVIIMISKEIAQGYRSYFELIWNSMR